ncbi:MAG: alpha/beta fold hydrolase [Halanaeroarchaeum sp.]
MPTETVNGAELYYEETGEGQPVVFLHGVMMGSRFFIEQQAGLPDRIRPIVLDFRGHGRSETTETGHTLPTYAADVEAFLAAQGLEDVVLVGWSMGALVGWEFVEQFGTDRLRGFVVVDQHPADLERDDYDHGAFDFQQLVGLLELTQRDPHQVDELFLEEMFAGDPDASIERLVRDEMSRVPASVKSTILFDQSVRDYRDVLSTVDVPTLVCLGADETLLETRGVEYVAEETPEATLERFEESGHCPFLEQPAQFNAALADFVSSISS